MFTDRPSIPLTAVFIGVPVLIGAGFYLYISRKQSSSSLKVDGEHAATSERKLTPSEQMLHLKKIGNQAYIRKSYSLAIENYTKGIELSSSLPSDYPPQDLAIFYQNRAACNEALENYEAVIQDCDFALALNKNYVKPYLRRARAYQKLNQPEKALVDAFCANLLEKFQNQTSLNLTEEIGTQWSKLEASEAMKSREPRWPSNQTIRSYFSAFTTDPVKQKLGCDKITNSEQLQPLLDEANRPENDDDPMYLSIRGSCFTLMSNPKGASEAFDKLMAMSNEKCPTWIKANALIKKSALAISEPPKVPSTEKDLEPIQELLHEAMMMDSSNPDVYLHQAQVNALLDKLEDAMNCLNMAISLKPDFYPAIAQKFYNELKLISKRSSKEELTEFLGNFKAVVKENPHASDLLQMYSQVLAELNFFHKADQVLCDLIKLDPTDCSLLVSRSLIQLQLNSGPEAASGFLREALLIDPKTMLASELLGSIELQSGRVDAACKVFEQALNHTQTEDEYAHFYCLMRSAKCQKEAADKLGLQM